MSEFTRRISRSERVRTNRRSHWADMGAMNRASEAFRDTDAAGRRARHIARKREAARDMRTELSGASEAHPALDVRGVHLSV